MVREKKKVPNGKKKKKQLPSLKPTVELSLKQAAGLSKELKWTTPGPKATVLLFHTRSLPAPQQALL